MYAGIQPCFLVFNLVNVRGESFHDDRFTTPNYAKIVMEPKAKTRPSLNAGSRLIDLKDSRLVDLVYCLVSNVCAEYSIKLISLCYFSGKVAKQHRKALVSQV